MDSFLITVVLLLCTVIAIQVINIIAKFFYSENSIGEDSIIVIPIKKHENAIEFKLRNIIRHVMWRDDKKAIKILLLDVGADIETLNICKKICEEQAFVELCDRHTISSILADTLK
ncbi:MAG: hypothetical protein GX365_02205 [Clostridiales bacterium]|nr:hypothetical protein [Clostridiales bacterium]